MFHGSSAANTGNTKQNTFRIRSMVLGLLTLLSIGALLQTGLSRLVCLILVVIVF